MGRRRSVGLVAAAAALAAALAGGCDRNAAPGGGPRIALLLPESKAARYEVKDRPYFEARVRDLCARCRVTYANAGADPHRQLSQVEAALANRAAVVVLDAVDARAARAAAIRAEEAGVPLVAYDRLIDDRRVDWYVGFDNEAVGRLQARYLAGAVAGRPGAVVMLHGAASDPNAAGYRRGAAGELRRLGVPVAAELSVDGWNPGRARTEMARILARRGTAGISGVYVANDAMAGAAVDAFEEAGVPVPPVTGQDAELEALHRILDGRQAMTVYKPLRAEAVAAAEAAVALAGGRRPSGATGPVGAAGVPAVVLQPVAVGPHDLGRVVTADRFWPAAEVCAGRPRRCAEEGL
ncbi:MAG TPA: substrate-binding domain-containing protein [Acidimicrobiia bacterium]|nr:substrate-binding domain-containing protein [Acidimicrobiia bacterium]